MPLLKNFALLHSLRAACLSSALVVSAIAGSSAIAADTKLAEAKTPPAKATEVKSTESKSTEVKSSEVKPGAAKATESKAVELKAPETAPAELKSPLTKLELKDGDGIVFYGDSITHQRLYTQYISDYFYTRYPHMRLRLHNAGVSGSVAWEALERFDRDVAAYKPKYVTVLLGMNDGMHEPFNPAVYATYRQDMTTIFEKIQAIGATPIVMTPTMFDARVRRAKRPHANVENTSMYNSVMAYYGTWLREVATEKGYGFVDFFGPMNSVVMEKRKTDPKFTLVPDAVHPGPAGHLVMSEAIIRDLGLSREVSKIKVTLTADKQHQVTASGGHLTNLIWHDGGLEFNWNADSLPWVIPDEAKLHAQLGNLTAGYNEESLEVHGLPAGNYTLLIDGHEVGTYDNVQLEERVELQNNEKTPQYQQALVVANLSKERNEGPIDALRDEWWNFQDYVDAKRDVKKNPNDAKCKATLVTLEHKINGMEARVEKDDAAAKVIEDKIFELNKPTVHKYALVRKTAKVN